MPLKDTPPLSPSVINMEEEDVLELSDLEDVDESDLEEITCDGMDVDSSDSADDAEEIVPERDDAKFVFTRHDAPVFSCHLDPRTGNLAVTGGEDDKAYIWETQTGNVVLECKGHQDSVTCVEFSHDGAYVATGDMGGIIQVWKTASMSLACEANVGELLWLKWHHGAHVLLGGMATGEVYVWRVPTGECKVLPGHGVRPNCGLVLPDGKRVAMGYEDGSVKVLDVKSTQVLHHVPAHGAPIISMDSHSDNNRLITGSLDGSVSIITTQTGKLVSTLKDMAAATAVQVEVVRFCPDASVCLAAVGTLTGTLYIWDLSRSVIRHKLSNIGGVTKLIWVKNSAMLFVGCLDGAILLIDALSGTLQATHLGHSNHILDIALSTDNNTLLSVSDDKTARVFNPVGPNR